MDDERLRHAHEAAAFAIREGMADCDGSTVIAILAHLTTKTLDVGTLNGIAGYAFDLVVAYKSRH